MRLLASLTVVIEYFHYNCGVVVPSQVTIEGEIFARDPYVIVLTQEKHDWPIYVSNAGNVNELLPSRIVLIITHK